MWLEFLDGIWYWNEYTGYIAAAYVGNMSLNREGIVFEAADMIKQGVIPTKLILDSRSIEA